MELTADRDTQAGRGRSCRLVIPPQPHYGAFARARLADFARTNGVPEADTAAVVMAVGEALANAFEHSHTSAKIEVSCWLVGRDQLVATVVDRGAGIPEPPRLATDIRLPEPTAERSRGFAIMRACTDALTVRSTPGRGTAVVLVRFIRLARSGRDWHGEMTG